MKKLFAMLGVLLVCFALQAQQCDINKGVAKGMPVLLKPYVTQTVVWDFSGCNVNITNVAFFATQPNSSFPPIPVSPGAIVRMSCINLNTKQVYPVWNYTTFIPQVTGQKIAVSLRLDLSATLTTKPVDGLIVELHFKPFSGGVIH